MTLSDEQIAELEAVCAKLEVRMVEKPRRYQPPLGVAKTAYEIARAYDVDCFSAALAGFCDWDKVLDDHELLVRAAQYGARVASSPPPPWGCCTVLLLFGELPHIFRGHPTSVTRRSQGTRGRSGRHDAARHGRVRRRCDRARPSRRLRRAPARHGGGVFLKRLFFQTFAQGLVYVISGGRYLYPTAIDIYNAYAAKRTR